MSRVQACHVLIIVAGCPTDRRHRRQAPLRPDVSPHRQTPRTRTRGQIPRRRLYRVTPYGQRFMSAAIAVDDQHFPAAYQQTAA